MDNSIVLGFLRKTHLSVIACTEDKILQDFSQYLLAAYRAAHEKPMEECSAEDAVRHAWTGGECAIVKGVSLSPSQKKEQIADKLKDLNGIAKACGADFFVPLGLQKRELRSVYFYIPESDKPNIQMFNLYHMDSVLRLECEFGENAGYYLVYDYDTATGQFKMREE